MQDYRLIGVPKPRKQARLASRGGRLSNQGKKDRLRQVRAAVHERELGLRKQACVTCAGDGSV